jgi:parvulin-like peptidyl-prolyl isomerase
MTKRQLSRWQREKRRERILIGTIAGIAIVVVAVLAFGLYQQFISVPSSPVATVNGQSIRRDTYDKVRKFQIIQQFYYQQQYMAQSGQQTDSTQLDQQLKDEKSAAPDQTTVDGMVEDNLLAQKAPGLGLSVTAADIDNEVKAAFAVQPTPSPEPSASAPVTGTATPETATPTAVPTPSTPEPTVTPQLDQAQYTSFLKSLQDQTGLSEQDYRDLIVKPYLLRTKLSDMLKAQIPTSQEQVHAKHILLKTEQDANDVLNQLKAGASFDALAAEKSQDPGSKDTGGDLGWFTQGAMVAQFDQAAFSAPVGTVVGPVKSDFGYHLILVVEKQANRPLTPDQLQQATSAAESKWWEDAKKAASIQEFTPPTPTPEPTATTPPTSAPEATAPETSTTPVPSTPAANTPAPSTSVPGTPTPAAPPATSTP